MLEVFFGVLLAVAVRDVYLEIINRYKEHQHNKRFKTFRDLLEDIEADDDDIK